jgi:hypothetical protein
MKLSYRFYRHNLIKLSILSVPIAWILLEHLIGKGNTKDETGALILLAVLVIVGNVGLFIAMRRAKQKEIAAQMGSLTPISTAQPNTVESRFTFHAALEKRKKTRRFMLGWMFVVGWVLVVFCKSWRFEGMPAWCIGGFLIILGVLGLLGINVFYGGPLDLRLDRKQGESN